MDDGLVSARQCAKPTQREAVGTACEIRFRRHAPMRKAGLVRQIAPRLSGINGYIGRITLRQTGLRILQFKAPVPIAGEIDANLQIPRGGRGIRRGILGILIGKHGPTGPRSRPSRAAPARGGAADTAGRRRSRPAGRQSTFAPCCCLSQWHVVRPLPGRPETAGDRQKACRSARWPRLRPTSSTTKASSTATAASACSARCSPNSRGTGPPMARQRMRRRESGCMRQRSTAPRRNLACRRP